VTCVENAPPATVEANGFRPETRRNIVLEINEKVRADFELQIGGTQERVALSTRGQVFSSAFALMPLPV